MNKRTFRANANFYFEYEQDIDDRDNPQQAVDVDQKFFENDPLTLVNQYNFISCEVDVEDITNMTTPEENAAMSSMEPRLENAIRDWWLNHREQDALYVQEEKIQTKRRALIADSQVLASRIDEFTESYSRHLMLNVHEDYFVILVWNPEFDSHTIEVMQNEFGGKS